MRSVRDVLNGCPVCDSVFVESAMCVMCLMGAQCWTMVSMQARCVTAYSVVSAMGFGVYVESATLIHVFSCKNNGVQCA